MENELELLRSIRYMLILISIQSSVFFIIYIIYKELRRK